MFKINWTRNLWNQSELRGGDGVWLYVRRSGDYKEVPLFYSETMGM